MDPKYVDWVNSVIEPINDSIILNGSIQFKIRAVDEIHVLNSSDYESVHNGSSKGALNFESGFEPSMASYPSQVSQGSSDVSGFYRKLKKVADTGGPSFWKPTVVGSGPNPIWESHIYLCPEKMKERSNDICSGLIEIHPKRIEYLYFRVALLHEIGHHITFCNFSKKELDDAADLNDKNLFESLASVIASSICSKEEKWVLAESTIQQKLCYRYYIFFRYSAIMNEIFIDLLNNHDPKSALTKFWSSIGVQLDLNGFSLTVESLNGLIMDWFNNGGKIISPGRLEFIGTIYDGCVIASQIDHLIGRFPSNTLILTNKINDMPDYGRRPDNIRLVSKNIAAIVNKHKGEPEFEKIKGILEDLGIEEEWKKRLLRPAKHNVNGSG